MVIRMWKGEAKTAMADVYRRHFEDTVLPRLRNIPGFIAAQLLNRRQKGKTEIVVTTKWDSMDAICRFAGDRPDRAVVEPGAREALSSFDETVAHYEVVTEI